MRKYLVFVASLAIAACNPVAQMGEADSQIEQFHAHYSGQDFDAIYANVSPELRDVASREQWNAIMTRVYGALGPVEDSSQSGFHINTNNGVTTTSITRETTYAEGTGTEYFTFYGSGENMVLDGWEVESDELVGAPAPDAASAEMVAKKPGG